MEQRPFGLVVLINDHPGGDPVPGLQGISNFYQRLTRAHPQFKHDPGQVRNHIARPWNLRFRFLISFFPHPDDGLCSLEIHSKV